MIRFGSDGVSQAKYVAGSPHPWKFIDTNDGITWLINHAVDTEYGPTHWTPFPDFRPPLTLHPRPVAGSAGQAPVGWKLVPVEPDKHMRAAAFDTLEIPAGYCGFETGTDARDSVYAAMIDAAPTAPSLTTDATDEERDAISLLIDLARVTHRAWDDSEEGTGDDGRFHAIGGGDFDEVSNALDALEELPDDKPGQTLNAAGKAEWALRALLAADPEQRMSDAARLATLERVVAGLPQDAIDGGWTARSISAYAKSLEGDAARYRWLRERAWYVDAATYALELRERWRDGDTPPPDVDEIEHALDAARKAEIERSGGSDG